MRQIDEAQQLPTRHLPARDYQALKAAFRALERAAGGQSAAARVTRVGQQQIGRYGSVADDDIGVFPPVDVIADLEAETGEPVVTRLLAELSGCDLTARGRKGRAAILRLFGDIAAQTSTVIAALAEDLADGTIDPEEAAAQRTMIRQLREALEAYDHVLAGIRDTPHPVNVSRVGDERFGLAPAGARAREGGEHG